MSWMELTRRDFLIVGGAVAAGALLGAPNRAHSTLRPESRTIHRLSLRGRRGSKSAKIHNANFLFATESAADANRHHPGDNSRIVRLVVSEDEYHRLFTSRGSDVADLRALGGPVLVGDCNRNGEVTSDELVHGIRIAQGGAPVSGCTAFDRIADGRVSIDELIRGVGNVLR